MKKRLLKSLMDVTDCHPWRSSMRFPGRQGLAGSGLWRKLGCGGLAPAPPWLAESLGAGAFAIEPTLLSVSGFPTGPGCCMVSRGEY